MHKTLKIETSVVELKNIIFNSLYTWIEHRAHFFFF
jgi:hypothetical protein